MYFPFFSSRVNSHHKCGARPKSSIIRTAVPAAIITHLSSRPFKRWMFFSREGPADTNIRECPWIFRPEHRHWRLHKFCWEFFILLCTHSSPNFLLVAISTVKLFASFMKLSRSLSHISGNISPYTSRGCTWIPPFSVSQNKEFILSSITSKSSSTIISAF